MSLAKRPKFYELQVPIGRANTIAKRVPQQSRQRLPALILGCYWNSNASPRSRSAISDGDGVRIVSAIFSNIRKATATLCTATTTLPIYAKSLNGVGHPHIIFVGDDEVYLSELDWEL